MTEDADLNKIPQSAIKPKKKMRLSVVWIIPIVAAIVGVGIAIQQIISKGPMITIVFKEAEGLEAGKTYVKYKDVNIGRVEAVKLSKDFKKVVVNARIDKSAAGLIVEDAKFWIEQPRITLSGVSGIGTLLSGNHIGVEVGKSTKPRREFIGLDEPPAVTRDQPGREFSLKADDLGSIGIGTPLYYRRINVGRVIGYNLADDGKSLIIHAFVNSPYDKYVTQQTRFWHASGIDVSLGANGVSVKTQSVMTMLIGGIAFENPPSASESQPAAEGTVFALFSDYNAATTRHETMITNYVLLFKESLRGLSVGAPVTFLGLSVGEVTGVGLEYNAKTDDVHPRVDIAIYPARFLEHVKDSTVAEQRAQSAESRRDFMQRMINRGLRAQLRSGNLVTGQLYVAFDIFPNAPKAKIDWTKSPYEFPVTPSTTQDLQIKLSKIVDKIDKIPLDAIGENARKSLASLNKTLNRLDSELMPEVKTAVQDLRKAIATTERMLANADNTIVGKDAPTQQELREALQEVARAARSVSNLAEYLERNPSALIRGKKQEVPK